MPHLRDDYTFDIDEARAAAIPMIQRAARDEAEEGHTLLNRTYAEGIDDILSWLDGEQAHEIIGSRKIREAAMAALTVETTACKHCGHGIGYNPVEGWVAPDAGFDREGGDGMWRDLCPDRDDEPNPPHVPDTHPEHTECFDGCGLDIDHDGECREKPGGRIVCHHEEEQR